MKSLHERLRETMDNAGMTIANETDQEVTYTVTPTHLSDFAGPCIRCGSTAPQRINAGPWSGERLCAACANALTLDPDETTPAWTGAASLEPSRAAVDEENSLEHALSVAEEVGIGPSEEVDLHATADAKVWAQEFMRVLRAAPLPAIDEDLMLAWFANAIMTGWDHGRRRLLEEHGHINRLKPRETEAEPRFGDRLRGEVLERARIGQYLTRAGMEHIAGAIDQDQEQQCARLVERRIREQADLRRKVEELVEELRFSVNSGGRANDVLSAEQLLERLAGIFGGRKPRTELCALTRFLRDVQEVEAASPEAEDSIVISVGDLEIIAERYIGSQT